MPNSYPAIPDETTMKRTSLEASLGLTPPRKVTNGKFSPKEKWLDINIDFEPGSTFTYPVPGAEGAKVYDTQELTRPHLNFFQHKTYLHALIHRIKCPKGDDIRMLTIPWARSCSGFTPLFEAFTIARGEMAVSLNTTYQHALARKLIDRIKGIISSKVLCKVLGKV